MIEIHQSETFSKWLGKLKDIRGKAHILARIERFADGNAGDTKFLSDGIYEMRIHYSPGYRVYYTQIKDQIVLLLVGGAKKTQSRDIKKAIKMAKNLQESK